MAFSNTSKCRLHLTIVEVHASGGVRVIYYHVSVVYQIRLILIYRKGIKDDLSEAKKILAELNRGWT